MIWEGLEEGDLICLSPLEAAVNGTPVRTADSDDSTGFRTGNGGDA
ncbi:MAG: hypothetical protein OXI33_05180 [Chloroflexota bacterium]|nr:hypothetical protein [Chloroflexota bacterium]